MRSTVKNAKPERENQPGGSLPVGELKVSLLEAFVLLACLGKRTAVAHELRIEQGTVTKRIQELERWAGTVLVEHQSSPAKLTRQGVEFLPKAQAILTAIEDARVFKPEPNMPTAPKVSVSQLRAPSGVLKSDKV
ncbi:LysR family transcriptional regulator [Brevundimonas sp.]|uniref:LysR family transcriptional regulator n=1 Tax=Brevundimonas sp. TaxID=1871086 RepID=UPI00289F2D19|nr:LysR family transcriptional regulator [Brevundimonas sp.]